MVKILTLCTYPVAVPRHGGQVRVNAIHQIHQAAGHSVRHLALYREQDYPDEPSSPWNIHFSGWFINELLAIGGRTDVNAVDFLLRDADARDRALALIRDYEPDVIQLEQCWLWPLIKTLRGASEKFRSLPIVYSSQNVEYQLIAAASGDHGRPVANETVTLIRQMEMDLVANADLVITVSKADADVFRPVARQVTIAANGIWPRGPAGGQDYWSKELRRYRFALFVGSAHPPNATGFVNLLGPSLGFLSPLEKIVVVGGVGNLLQNDRHFRENIGQNLARSMLVGVQDNGGLSTLLEMADVVLVPITEGGGTNIKMAEALYNRKLVICTPKAARGFEAFTDMPSMLLCATPDEFKGTLVKALRGEINTRPALTFSQMERLKALLWSSTLADIGARVGYLAAGRHDPEQARA